MNCKLPIGLLLIFLSAAIFFGIYWAMGKQLFGFPKKKCNTEVNTEGIHIKISEDMNEQFRELFQDFIYNMQYTSCKSPDLINAINILNTFLNEFNFNNEMSCSEIKDDLKIEFDKRFAELETQEEKDALKKVNDLFIKFLDILCNNNDDTKISVETVTDFFIKIFGQLCPINDLEEHGVFDLNLVN